MYRYTHCRCREFEEKWELDKWLSADGFLDRAVRPFFIALPKDKKYNSNSHFRERIQQVDTEVLHFLNTNVRGGFDEERFGDRIGFGQLKLFLEGELQRRYAAAVPHTSAMLQKRKAALHAENSNLEEQMAAAGDVVKLRKSGMCFVAQLVASISTMLAGSVDPDPAKWGHTLEEEWKAFESSHGAKQSNGRWPGVEASSVKTPNAKVRLYGGAAFDRAIAEFQAAANACAFPKVSEEKIANVMLSGVSGLSAKVFASTQKPSASKGHCGRWRPNRLHESQLVSSLLR